MRLNYKGYDIEGTALEIKSFLSEHKPVFYTGNKTRIHKRWTPGETAQLWALNTKGVPIQKIAKSLRRKRHAVKIRLRLIEQGKINVKGRE